MPALSVREVLIRTGAIKTGERQPMFQRVNTKAPKAVSRVNAIIARRAMMQRKQHGQV